MAGFAGINMEKTMEAIHAALDKEFEFNDLLLDEVDGADETFFRNRYFLNMHQSMVFNSDLVIKDILSDYKVLAQGMTSLTDDRGVVKKILRQGDGTTPSMDVEIFLHYNGFLEGHDEPFDASIMRKNHQIFKLKDYSLFPGMQLAVESMQYNEVAEFIFKPKYFFGDLGCPPKIPKDTPALFFIELLNIKNIRGEKKIHEMSFEELQALSFKEITDGVEKLKEAGNVKYNLENYKDAITRYNLGLHVLTNYIVGGPAEETAKNILKQKLMSNLAQCHLMTKNAKKAINICKLALKQPEMPKPCNSKLHFRYANALFLHGDVDEASNILQEGMTIEPNNQALHSLMKQVQEMLQKQKNEALQREKVMINGLFDRSGDSSGQDNTKL